MKANWLMNKWFWFGVFTILTAIATYQVLTFSFLQNNVKYWTYIAVESHTIPRLHTHDL